MSQAPAAPGSRPLRLDVVTIFPDYLRALDLSLVGKAADTGLIDLHVHDLREWTHDRHRTVDDTPLGGGAGMVMKPDVWGEALDAVLAPPAGAPAQSRRVLVIPAPSGDTFTQRTAEDLARADQVVFACGRYEGIDARVAEHYRSAGVEVRELSIGDYVLSGGEAATLVMIEAVARLRPGVLGNPASVVEESHGGAGLLEHPVHTRPVAWRGLDLADSDPHLLSGDHARIARARRDQALARTAARRGRNECRADCRNGRADAPQAASHPALRHTLIRSLVITNGVTNGSADPVEDVLEPVHAVGPLPLRLLVREEGLALPLDRPQLSVHFFEDPDDVSGTALDVGTRLVDPLVSHLEISHDSYSCLVSKSQGGFVTAQILGNFVFLLREGPRGPTQLVDELIQCTRGLVRTILPLHHQLREGGRRRPLPRLTYMSQITLERAETSVELVFRLCNDVGSSLESAFPDQHP